MAQATFIIFDALSAWGKRDCQHRDRTTSSISNVIME
jgi:hypothetical protein